MKVEFSYNKKYKKIQMKTTRKSDSQIMQILSQADSGVPISELCRERGMSGATFYKWCAKYGGMDTSMITRLKEPEAENSHLKMNSLFVMYS